MTPTLDFPTLYEAIKTRTLQEFDQKLYRHEMEMDGFIINFSASYTDEGCEIDELTISPINTIVV